MLAGSDPTVGAALSGFVPGVGQAGSMALASVLGDWAMVGFLVGTLAAVFDSIVPITWAPADMIPEALGERFADDGRPFTATYVVGVGLPITALLLLWAVNDAILGGEL